MPPVSKSLLALFAVPGLLFLVVAVVRFTDVRREYAQRSARCEAELQRESPWRQGLVAVDTEREPGRERQVITVKPPPGLSVVWGGLAQPTTPYVHRDLPALGSRIEGEARFRSEWVTGTVTSMLAVSLRLGPKLWRGAELAGLVSSGATLRFPLDAAATVVAASGETAWNVPGSVGWRWPLRQDGVHRHVVDVLAPMGAEVRSPVDGVVVEVEERFRDLGCPLLVGARLATWPMRNRLVLYSDDGLIVGMEHLQQGSVSVSPGDRVVRGQPLARVGRSGDAWVEHLRIHVTVLGEKGIRSVPMNFVTRDGAPWDPRLGEVPDAVRLPD